MSKELPNHILDYFTDKEQSAEAKVSKELFKAKDEDIDLKTDLTSDEIKNIASMNFNDEYLISKGLKPVFKRYYIKYMRLLLSKNRQSRTEFVNINKGESKDDIIQSFSNLSNIGASKK